METIKPNICNTPRKLTYIQDHGTIIIIDKDTLSIIGYSENFLSITKNVNINFIDLIDHEYKLDIKEILLKRTNKSAGDLILKINNQEYFCHHYKTDGAILIELEIKTESLTKDMEIMLNFLNSLTDNNILNYKDSLVKTIHKLTNFDRVMMYKFHSDWSGEVIAEYINIPKEYPMEIESFNGRFFPETDIPQYVRGLFCRNKSRYIKSVNNSKSKVIYKRNDTENFIDVSMSDLISPQGSHVNYLNNMGVKSAFSLSLIINNKLWGIIACHSIYKERYISPKIRKHCLKIVELFSNKTTQGNNIINTDCHLLLLNIYEIIKTFDNFSEKEIENIYHCVVDNIFKFIKADFVVGKYNNTEIYKDLEIYNFIKENLSKFGVISFSTNVSNDFGIKNKNCSGIVLIKLEKDNWIAFLKKETIVTKIWGGNPGDTIINQNSILPRTHFNEFITKEKSISSPWNITDENIDEIKDVLNHIITNNSGNKELFISESKGNIDKKQNIIIANLTHEIRNPLNAINGILELLKDDNISDQKEIIQDGIKVVDILKNLINNMIDFTKNKYGYTSVYLKNIDISSMVNDIYNVYKYSVNKNVVMTKEISDEIPKELIGDSDKITQIISNLLSNSCKYTEKGKINIKLNSLNISKSVYWIEIIVSDTGIGIPGEKQYLIFREFEQISKLSKASSGLGLSLCHQLVTMLNGSITFISEELWGSTFTCRLPLGIIPDKKKIKVLVVDDFIINQKIMKAKLTKLDYLVSSSNNGQQVVDMIENGETFDIIIMDIFMPIMDGLSATKLVREMGYKGIIIGLSGTDTIKDTYFDYGMNGFLLKPLEYNKIHGIIQGYLS